MVICVADTDVVRTYIEHGVSSDLRKYVVDIHAFANLTGNI